MPHAFDEVRKLGVDVPPGARRSGPDGYRDVDAAVGADALESACRRHADTTLSLADDGPVTAITGEAPDVLALGAQRMSWQREINRLLGIGLRP
jgi:hypothetical protein